MKTRRSVVGVWVLVLVLVAIGGAAVTGALAWTGRIRLPFLARSDAEMRVPAGSVAIPLSASLIPAYTQITRDHIWDPKRQRPSVIVMRRDSVPPGALTEFRQIRGRVLGRDKAPGYVFTEDDFLPEGTRPGLAGGIPPGKRAMRFTTEQLHGAQGLRAGDRVDVVATIPVDPKAAEVPLKGTTASVLGHQAKMANVQKQATVRTIVQNGTIVQPVTTRQVPTTSRTLTQGTVVAARPVQEVVVAVDPREVPVVTEALAVKADLQAVPRSGRPDDPKNSRTPDLKPWTPLGRGSPGGVGSAESSSGAYAVVEKITGTSREPQLVPRR